MKPDLLPSSPEAKRIAAIFHRQLTTRWTPKEVKALCILKPIDEEELSLIERYYRMCWPPRTGVNHLRHDLYTFLNNFHGEGDRARVWCHQHPVRGSRTIRAGNGTHPPISEPPLEPEAMARFRAEFERARGKQLYSAKP